MVLSDVLCLAESGLVRGVLTRLRLGISRVGRICLRLRIGLRLVGLRLRVPL